LYSHDHHDNYYDDNNDYVYKSQYLLLQWAPNMEGNIHNNKGGHKVRKQVNTRIELLAPFQLPQPVSLPEHLL
jgi:hypothetical protein